MKGLRARYQDTRTFREYDPGRDWGGSRKSSTLRDISGGKERGKTEGSLGEGRVRKMYLSIS